MTTPEPSELSRLRALRELDLLDTPAEARFDRIIRMAVDILRVPMAALELVDETRVWRKSSEGIEGAECARAGSFADAVIREPGSLVLADALADERAGSPAGSLRPIAARFLAGHPLRIRGEAVGSLTLMGPEPRRMSPAESRVLLDLAAILERELGVRRWSAGQDDALGAHSAEKRRALVDPEIRVWNRQGISEVLQHELDRVVESAGVLSVMMASVHPVRPSRPALRDLAARIRGALRPSDALGLWDEGTFLILLPGWEAGTAERAALRVVEAVQARAGGRAPSMSVGIAAAERETAGRPAELLERVESALLDARVSDSAGLRVRRAGPAPSPRLLEGRDLFVPWSGRAAVPSVA